MKGLYIVAYRDFLEEIENVDEGELIERLKYIIRDGYDLMKIKGERKIKYKKDMPILSIYSDEAPIRCLSNCSGNTPNCFLVGFGRMNPNF